MSSAFMDELRDVPRARHLIASINESGGLVHANKG
jgi:hypothetical protein